MDITENSVAQKYCRKPSVSKKRKLKESVAEEDTSDHEEENIKKKKPNKTVISVEKIPSLQLSELQERLHEKLKSAKSARNYSKEKLQRRKEKRNLKEKAPKKKIIKNSLPTSILDENKKPLPSEKSEKPKANMQFSKFQTKSKEEVDLQSTKKKSKKKDLKKLLENAKQNKKELTTLQKSTDEKSTAALQSKAWKKAISMAKGEKQKDNPDLIVKSIKRQDQKKKKSSIEWNDRVGSTKNLQKAKQKKRQANIEKRIKGTSKKK